MNFASNWFRVALVSLSAALFAVTQISNWWYLRHGVQFWYNSSAGSGHSTIVWHLSYLRKKIVQVLFDLPYPNIIVTIEATVAASAVVMPNVHPFKFLALLCSDGGAMGWLGITGKKRKKMCCSNGKYIVIQLFAEALLR